MTENRIKTVSSEYPELMHYTSASGLKGILESQSLWATHALFLNDAEEQTVFFDAKLKQLLTLAAKSLNIQGADEVVDQVAAEFAEIIRRTTLKFNQTFITSLSAPHNAHVSKNGLLSQWRGYGTDGGYALVFDAAKIEDGLRLERYAHDYQHMQFADVYYFDDESPNSAPPEIQQAEETLKSTASEFLQSPTESGMEEAYDAITTLSALYKNYGFHEEHEVRVVAIPMHRSVTELPDAARLPSKPVNTFVRNGCLIPYISLFSTSRDSEGGWKLPLKRVIVGPHRDKVRHKDSVEFALEALGIEAEVDISAIPYVG